MAFEAVQRTKRTVLLLKLQADQEVYEDPDPATDGLRIEVPTINLNPQNTQTNETSYSLDAAPDIVGGTQVSLSFPVYLKGNNQPGVAPQWVNAFRICAWDAAVTHNTKTGITFAVTGGDTITDSADGLAALTEGTVFYLVSPANPGVELLVTASAAGELSVAKPDGSAPNLTNEAAGGAFTLVYGVPAVDATGGDTLSVTAQAPWSNTAQAYRGMPVLVSGNPVVPFWTSIIDYLAARVATLSDKFGTALSASSVVSIPANVLLKPTSDDADIPAASIAVLMDGVRWKFSDVRGTLQIAMTAGKTWQVTFNLSALFVDKDDAALPASVAYDATTAGAWRDSKFLIDRARAAVQSFSLDNGLSLVFPDDPNAQEGFSTPVHTARKMRFTADPRSTLVATRNLVQTFRTGVRQAIHCALFGGAAAHPGSRIIVNIPTAQYDGANPADRNGLATEQLSGTPVGDDSGAFICIY